MQTHLNVIGVDLCLRVRGTHYCMFHHEPPYGDEKIHYVLGATRRCAAIAGDGYALQLSIAHDGVVIDA
jgi:hypothetical protein